MAEPAANGADDSMQVVVRPKPAESRRLPVADLLAIVGGTLAIIASLVGTGWWLVQTADAATTAAEKRTEELLDAHATRPHADAVSQTEYERHLDDAKRVASEARQERRDIGHKLDAIGERLYRSEDAWQTTVKAREAPTP